MAETTYTSGTGTDRTQGTIHSHSITETGTYRITLRGGAGGQSSDGSTMVPAGYPAVVQFDIEANAGETFRFLPGARGGSSSNSSNVYAGGGGGGSFVWFSATNGLIAAAGGSGSNAYYPISITCDANLSQEGKGSLGGVSGAGGGSNGDGGGGAGMSSGVENGGGLATSPSYGGYHWLADRHHHDRQWSGWTQRLAHRR